MARVIRYLEDGIWKYASIKDVGDLEKLKTVSKADVVSAINELVANGNAMEIDLGGRVDGLEGQANELVQITGNVQEVLGQVQGELNDKVEKMYLDEQMNKLVSKEAYDANYQEIQGELLDKVDINKYNTEYNEVTNRLKEKADLSAFNGVEGRVSTTEQEITNVKGELSSKVGKTEYDGAVGLNRWIARKYDVNIGSTGAIPSFEHIKGKQPDAIVDYDDNVKLQPFVGDYYIGHYFTNIYMKNAKTVTVNVTNDDGAVIYMNGAKMYEGGTRTTVLPVALTFRAGWNTIEILHYEHSGATEHVTLGVKLSAQVDKMTSVIGVGDKNETRLTQAETEIKQTSEAIKLKAEGAEVTQLGNKVTNNEASINVMKDEIKLLVKTEDFNKYTGRLETAESTIIQHSDQISQKVEKTEHDALNNIVVEQQTSINQLTDEIDLKATKSEYDGLNGRVGNAETQLNLNTEAIRLKAEKTELDKTNGRLSTAEAQLTVQAGEIASKVTQEDIDDSLSPIESRVGNAESTIVQHATAIGLKANANEVYKKTEADGKVSTAITQAKGEIKIETDKISQNVTNLTQTVTTQGTAITNHETSITQMKGSIDLKAEKKDVYTKAESDGKVSTAVTQAKAEIKLTTDGITQNVTNVQGDLDTLEGTVVAQGTQIKQTSEEVAINVVKKGNVKASINASTEGIKIGGQHVDITGQVTFSTLDPTMQGKVNAGTDAKTKIDGLQISSNNLLLDSHKDFSTTDYLINTYTLSEDLVSGQEYTFVIKGTVPAGQKFGIWLNGSANNVGYATTTYVNGATYATFKAVTITAGNERKLSLYNVPQNTTVSTVDWVALYKGNKPMDWMPATSDMEKLIGGASPNIILNSGFLQGTKFWGTPATGVSLDTTLDLDGIPIIKSIQSGNATDVWRGMETDLYPAPLDRPITFSAYSFTPDLTKLDEGLNIEIKCYDKNKARITSQTYAITATPSKSNSWERFSRTITITGDKNIKYINLFVYVRKNGTGYFAKPMIQQGSTLGDWTPNPNDVIIDSLDNVSQSSKNAIADMANDNKATPVEKTQLKKEWATIVAEKPQYEALATTYGITTEKTNYVNAYNALNTAITPIIANATVTSDINGATFRATFDDYYDKKAQLIKRINELSRTIGTNADTKAQEAKNSIADMSSDSKITPVEKVQLAKEWAVMVAEKPQYEALSTTYGITTEKTNFVNAYNTLNTVLNGTGGILTSMTTTSAVTGSTFRAQFDDYYDKKAQLVKAINVKAKSLADGAQGTANTANTTANTANNAINTNKATWDRASNINSNGTFNSSKLSGAILDAQISSAVNWNGAKSLLDSWKSGTTMINGGMIATNTIFAQQIAIGDFTNLSQINEEKNPNGYPTVLLSGKRFFKIGNGAYASITIVDTTYVEFKVNDEYYIAFNGYRDSGLTSLNLIMRYHYTDGTWTNAGVISALPTTAETRIIKNLKITTAPDDTKTISRVQLFLEKDGTAGSGYYYMRDIEVRKRYTGELIVDGSIKVAQIDVASLFANSAFINNIKAQTISGDKVVGGKISGVTYESINASNPKIKVVIEGNTVKSYGASDGTKQNYSELKEGLIKVFEMAETGSPFGDKGTAIQPASVTVTHGGKNTKIFPFNIEFKEGTVVGNINFEGLPNGGGAGISIQADSGIQVVTANSDKPALQFVSNESVIYNGWGNIVGNPYSSQYATWSIKDGDGKLRFLTPVGRGGTQATEIRTAYGGLNLYWQDYQFMSFWGDSVNRYIRFGDGGSIKWQNSQGRFEIRNNADSNWGKLAGIIENTSSREYKKNISMFDRSALDIINASKARLYHYTSQEDSERLNIGLIAEEAPELIRGQDSKTVDGYGMTTLAWKAIQELSEQVRYLKEQLKNR